jgi:hypothetical protein
VILEYLDIDSTEDEKKTVVAAFPSQLVRWVFASQGFVV